MKRILPLLVIAVMAFATESGFAQVTTAEVLAQAQDAMAKGDTDTAKERFEFVLKIDPGNRTATNFLRTINAQDNKSNKTGALEKQLKELIMPQVELKEATFDTSLDYLRQQVDKVSGGKVKISFVVQVPSEDATAKKVTLSLRSLPFTEVLHYMAELTGYKFTIEKYAITVKLPSAEPVPVTSNEPVQPPIPGGMPIQPPMMQGNPLPNNPNIPGSNPNIPGNK